LRARAEPTEVEVSSVLFKIPALILNVRGVQECLLSGVYTGEKTKKNAASDGNLRR